MKRLLMIAPAPVIRTPSGFIMDEKFISGMELQCRLWAGEVDCMLREGAQSIPFGAREVTSELAFGLKVLKPDEKLSARLVEGYDLVFCSIDDVENLDIVDFDFKDRPKLCGTIEYTLRTRLQAAWLDKGRSVTRNLRTMIWLLLQEKRRKNFIRKADALQVNGYPALSSYQRLNKNSLLYLDNRMTESLFANEKECEARAHRLKSGAPLRLVYSGRLERMKGAHDLVPIAKALRARNLAFHLDIFGDGQLKGSIFRDVSRNGLEQDITLHDAVDFETRLVPFMRKNSDIYLCCHRQSDPSCSYLENMGCGLSVVGFDNQMWKALQSASGAGWVSPVGKNQAIADLICNLDSNRNEIIARSDKALAFARSHDFSTEFRKRMVHLAGI